MGDGLAPDREFVDVENLVNYAVDRVPQLASEILGIQQPTKALPRGGQSFEIGDLSPSAQGVRSVTRCSLRAILQHKLANCLS